MLSKTEASELSGVPPTTLQTWIELGLVHPASSNGVGRGNGHSLTRMQVLGLAVANVLRNESRGCAQSYIQEVVSAFSDWDEAELEGQLKKGQTAFLMVHYDRPLLRGQRYENWPNVKALWKRIKDSNHAEDSHQ
jgi:DNA-binding transcriptional MerR regulator